MKIPIFKLISSFYIYVGSIDAEWLYFTIHWYMHHCWWGNLTSSILLTIIAPFILIMYRSMLHFWHHDTFLFPVQGIIPRTLFWQCSASWIFLTKQFYQQHCRPASRQFLTKFFFRHRNMSFTTRDRDNDVDSGKNCALAYRGGWWYSACHNANPNGLYQGGSHAQGITWAPFRGQDYSLKHTEIKLRPVWFYLKKLHVQAPFAKW